MRRDAYDAKRNPELIDALCAYQSARRYFQWMVVALKYRGDEAAMADVVERTVRRHSRVTAAVGAGVA